VRLSSNHAAQTHGQLYVRHIKAGNFTPRRSALCFLPAVSLKMPSLRSASIQTGSTHTESEYEDETDAEDEPPVKPKRGTAKSKSLNSEADTKRSKSGPISSKPVLGSMKTKAAKAAPAPKPVRTVKVDDEEDNAPTGRKRKGVTRSPTPPPTLANRPVKKSKLETSVRQFPFIYLLISFMCG